MPVRDILAVGVSISSRTGDPSRGREEFLERDLTVAGVFGAVDTDLPGVDILVVAADGRGPRTELLKPVDEVLLADEGGCADSCCFLKGDSGRARDERGLGFG